jgi:hypothetical protein
LHSHLRHHRLLVHLVKFQHQARLLKLYPFHLQSWTLSQTDLSASPDESLSLQGLSCPCFYLLLVFQITCSYSLQHQALPLASQVPTKGLWHLLGQHYYYHFEQAPWLVNPSLVMMEISKERLWAYLYFDLYLVICHLPCPFLYPCLYLSLLEPLLEEVLVSEFGLCPRPWTFWIALIALKCHSYSASPTDPCPFLMSRISRIKHHRPCHGHSRAVWNLALLLLIYPERQIET